MLDRTKLFARRLALLGISFLFAVSWGAAQQSLSVSSHTATSGSTVTLTVDLDDGTGIGGVQFTLNYDSNFIRIVDSDTDGDLSEEVRRGSLLGASHLMQVNAQQPGRILAVIAGTSSFEAGSGSVIAVDFQVLATSGSTSLTLDNVVASSPLGMPVPVTSSGGTITVQQSSTNHPPSAVDDSASTAEDTPVTIDVLSNDADPDDDALTITAVTAPGHGSATIVSGAVRYSPTTDYHGSDSFGYTISDGRGGTAAAVVVVTVTSVNDSPNASPDSASTLQDTPVTLSVLSNDSDPDGDSLQISSVTQPAHGSTSVQSGSSVRYTPADGYTGGDTFSYTITDGNGGTDSAQVTVTVEPPPAEPVLLIFPQFIDGGDAGMSPQPNSSRLILRNNAEAEAVVRVRFRSSDGTPMAVSLKGESAEVTQTDVTVEGFGVTELETAGSGDLKVGTVEVETLAGDSSRLRGTLVFSLLGTFVSVESSPLLPDKSIVVSVDPDPVFGERTGIAAHNPDSSAASTFTIRLRDQAGNVVASRAGLVLGPFQQVVGFVDEEAFFKDYFDGLDGPFLGSMEVTVTSGPDIASVGLVQKGPALGSALTALSTPEDGSGSGLIFPQFFDGGDAAGSVQSNSSRIIVRNAGETVGGRIRLTFRDGTGALTTVPIGGVGASSVDQDISALGVSRVETDGTGGAKSGAVEVGTLQGNVSLTGSLIYSIFGTFVSVENSPARTEQRVFISVDPDVTLGEDTGLSAYNPSPSQTAILRLVLRDDAGDAVATKSGVTLGPRQQLLGFVTDEAFFKDYLDTVAGGAFVGTLEISVTSGPDVAVLGLLQKRPAFNNALISVAPSAD